jgi:GDPmannose 4,6-dehydratase
MSDPKIKSKTAIVIGAAGQDGYFLTEQLLAEGWQVHAVARNPASLQGLIDRANGSGSLQVHTVDLTAPERLFDLIAREAPEEIYNLAGQSSVVRSFAAPLLSWRTNADFVSLLLECIRLNSPGSHFYQASSTEMFGSTTGATMRDEESPLNPQSPYAAAKAAAHLLCRSYRELYGLRIASGILSNHESHRRPADFLSHKVVNHVLSLRNDPSSQEARPLVMGNLKIERDWGFAPNYVEGIRKVARQIAVREVHGGQSQADIGANYRDYVLATGKTHTVWELLNCAFTIGGFDLEWDLNGDNPAAWRASFRTSGKIAVTVDPQLLRAAEPLVIRVDPGRAQRELGWVAVQGLEVFLQDMFEHLPSGFVAAAASE